MTDIELAKGNLFGHTLSLCKGGKCLIRDERGIAPMMNLISEGFDLSDYSVADLVVGKAVALLFVKVGIKRVFAKTLSQAAKQMLEKYCLDFEFEILAEKIINRSGTDICPMEKAVEYTDNACEAYELLKKQMLNMK